MREIIFFIASIAGAAVLTALAVLLQSDSPIWWWLLWVGIAIFIACAIVLLIDLIMPGGKVIYLLGMGTGLSVLVVSAVAFSVGIKEIVPDYFYVIPNSFDGGPFRLAVINPGKKPVINASLRIFNAIASPASMAASRIDQIGDIDPGYIDLNVAPIPAGYYINRPCAVAGRHNNNHAANRVRPIFHVPSDLVIGELIRPRLKGPHRPLGFRPEHAPMPPRP